MPAKYLPKKFVNCRAHISKVTGETGVLSLTVAAHFLRRTFYSYVLPNAVHIKLVSPKLHN